jgi:hypothetical protein
MKKITLLTALLCAALGGAALFAQNQWPDIEKYAELIMSPFVDTGTDWKKAQMGAANPEVAEKYASLQGGAENFDAALEVALYTFYYVFSKNAAYSVSPEAEAILPRNNPKLVDRQLGALVYKEMTVTRFLGNTAAAKWEAVLQTITGRGNVSRAEIEAYYRQNVGSLIAAVVDEEYNKRSFELRTGNKSYDVLLIRNSNNSYTVHYSRYLQNDDEEFTRPNLDALLDELKKRGFTSDNCATVRRESGLFPAVQRISGVTDNDTIELIKYVLADFYTANNQTTMLTDYKALLAIYNRYDNLYENNGKSDVVLSAINAMGSVLVVLSPELTEVFGRDFSTIIDASQRLSQQARAGLMSKLMSNNIEVLAGTVGEIRR